MNKALIALLCAASSAAVMAEDLRVVSYNAQFLPGVASAANNRKDPDYRAARIGAEMAAFDIVGLQEMFHDAHRFIALDVLKTAWGGVLNTVESPTPEGFMTSGGCVIATRMPIIAQNTMVFTVFSKPEDHGPRADGFAAKGVIHARIARDADKPEDAIDVFVTHLEARDGSLRPEQYKQMTAFIAEHTEAVRPMIVMGDLNTNGVEAERIDKDSQYNALMTALRSVRHGIVDAWLMVKPTELGGTTEQESADTGKRIDYIFYGPGYGGGTVATATAPAEKGRPEAVTVPAALAVKDIEVKLYRDDKVEALSDHNGVAAVFDWTPRD